MTTMAKDKYEWLPKESAIELRRRLVAAGDTLERIERRDTEHGSTYRVITSDGATVATADGPDDPDINESRLCPPICP
jgi:hypothetical protein